MARSRVWIGVLGVLLGGIVALNVWGLGLSAGSSATAAKIDELQRDNGVLRGRAATKTSTGRIEAAAAELGLAVPAPDGVRYLNGARTDAEKAAERLANGRISVAPPLVAATELTEPEIVPTEDPAVVPEPTIDPATGAAIDPATGAAIDPAAGAAIDPATGLPLTP